MTKLTKYIIALAAAGFVSIQAQAGTISYVPIPSTNSDTSAGISADNVYTSAIDGGNTTGTDRVINGVTLTSLPGASNTSTAGGITVNALTGTLTNGTGAVGSIAADGSLAAALQDMTSNDGATDGSQQEVVLDPATLVSGKTYDLRVYICNSAGQDREVDLSFACDGQAPVETGFFNEDDATTSGGAFADKNQVYYINYRFTWDGATTPGITITQKSGAMPFLLYALTNQEATSTPAAAPQPVADDQEPVGSGPGEDVGVESDQFYDDGGLNSHGHWVIVGRYGRCWQPADVGPDWAPYTRGHWVHCNYGWTWITDQTEEDWGWATYHYGRWCRVDGAGWCWVPGRVWAPAWVSWRTSNACVGWAPLPPDANCAPGVGISVWADSSYGLGPGAYNFVSVQNFGAPNLAAVIYARQRNVEFIQSTTNVTNIVNNNTVIYNGGPNVDTINAAIVHGGGAPVPTGLMLNRRGVAGPLGGGKFSQLQGNTLTLAGPRVTPAKNIAGLKPPTATFKTPKFDKGWSQVGDPKAAADLRKKIALDSKGKSPKTTKAILPGGVALPAANGVAGGTPPAGLHPGKAFKKGAAAGTPAPGAPAGPLHPGQKLSQVAPAGQKGIPNTPAPGARHPGQALKPATVPGAQPTATPAGGFHPGQKLTPATSAAVAQPTATPAGKRHGKTPNTAAPVAPGATPVPAAVHPGQTLPAAVTKPAQPTPTPAGRKHGRQAATPTPAPAPAVPGAATAPQPTPVQKHQGPSQLQQEQAAAAAAKQKQAEAAAAARQQQQAGAANAAKEQQQAAAAAAAKRQEQQAGAAAAAKQEQAAAARQQQQAGAAAAAQARQQQQAAAAAAAAAHQQQAGAAAAAAAKQQQAAAAAKAAAARGGKPTPTPAQ